MKNRKIYFYWVFLFFIFSLILSFFYRVNQENYKKISQIKENIVKHPENLPTKEMARLTTFWFKNIKADIYRLETIQYIGGNVIHAEYKKYLYTILDLITELNPYFENPYIIGQLLLPDYNYRYENLDKKEQENYIIQGEKIGLKGVKNFCDEEKLEKIKNEFDLKKIWTEEVYTNPCKSYKVPFHLAFVYYFHKKDPETSAYYYKVTSANKDSIEGAKVMSAIMQWKSWDREKSIFMFLSMAKESEKENKKCQALADQLGNIGVWIINKSIRLDAKLIESIEKTRNKSFWKFNEKREKEFLDDAKCSNYVNKTIREINLLYIEKANEKFKQKNNGLSARNAQALFEEWYLEFLPTDFQQYGDYGIIYQYNPDTQKFDYEMGNY